MSPAYKYTAGRFVLFAALFALLLPLPLNILVKAMIALFASAALSYFLLARWRNEMAEQIGSAVSRRQQEKARLRAALAGDEDAAAQGDRVSLSKTDWAAAPGDRVSSREPDEAAAPGDRVSSREPDEASAPADGEKSA